MKFSFSYHNVRFQLYKNIFSGYSVLQMYEMMIVLYNILRRRGLCDKLRCLQSSNAERSDIISKSNLQQNQDDIIKVSLEQSDSMKLKNTCSDATLIESLQCLSNSLQMLRSRIDGIECKINLHDVWLEQINASEKNPETNHVSKC